MTRSLTRSNAHFRKALTRLPLGVSSNFRYWGEDKTIYVAGAKGARIRDLDGNEYIDYRMAYGAGNPRYPGPRLGAAGRQGIGIGGRIRTLDRARIRGREPHLEDGAR